MALTTPQGPRFEDWKFEVCFAGLRACLCGFAFSGGSVIFQYIRKPFGWHLGLSRAQEVSLAVSDSRAPAFRHCETPLPG